MRSPVEVGKRVRELREAAELNQSQASQLCGFPRSAFGLIESTRRGDIGMSTMAALAVFFGTTIDWIVLRRGPEPRPEDIKRSVERARREPGRIREYVEEALCGVLVNEPRSRPLPRRASPARRLGGAPRGGFTPRKAPSNPGPATFTATPKRPS